MNLRALRAGLLVSLTITAAAVIVITSAALWLAGSI